MTTEAELKAIRAEGKNFEVTPPTNEEAAQGIIDWSMSGNKIDKAIRELNEALPAGQGARALSALALLEQGTAELKAFLNARVPADVVGGLLEDLTT